MQLIHAGDRMCVGTRKVISLASLCLIAFTGCASPSIRLGPETQPTFYLTGSNTVQHFQIAGKSGRVWVLYPNGKNLTLSDLGVVKFGEVPASCSQVEPKPDIPPPLLVEGVPYYAVAVIFDDDAVRVRFMVKDGKVIQLPEE